MDKEIDSQNIKIRLASKNDISSLYSILQNTINEMTIYNEDAKNYEKNFYTKEYLEELIKYAPTSLATYNDDIIGFCISKEDSGILWLSWLGVLPKYRGQNLGLSLILFLLKDAKKNKIHKVWSDTRSDNALSIKILEKLEFEKICILENHWYHQDYILWQKFI